MCRKELRNKFNGKLVMKWAQVGSGPIVAEIIEEFYEYIRITYGISYIEYIVKKTPREVKNDFFQYYDPISTEFGMYNYALSA